LIESKNIKGKQKDKLEEFINIAIEISEKNIYQSILYIMNEINIDEIYAKKDDADRKQNVNELLSAATEFSQESESKQDFLANAALLGSVDAETSQDAISLTTAHSSKGLEFDYVFIVALEDGLFPSDRAIMEDGIEEERRLGYVSITRARKELRMSYAKKRTFGGNYGKVTDESRFLVEIEPNLYKIKKYEYY
jgi:DNA helicase-2/ATP-dependent DNA helicase PcrA